MNAQPGRGPDSLFPDLLAFCVDSVYTCLSSSGADRLCVLLGLSSASALCLLLSGLVLVCQRCRCGGTSDESIVLFYCFLGDLCNTVGAVLSGQLYIQVLLAAFAAAVDAVNVIFCCFAVFLHWNSNTERRLRITRRRRRQHFLAVCVSMVVTGGFLKSVVNPTHRFLSGRRLLHVTLPDNTEILGYILGLTSFVIACTARFPALCRVYRGQMLPQTYVISELLCSTAASLYAAAILFYNTQIGFLLKVMPWLLSAICCVTLDLLIVVLHYCRRGTRQQLASLSFTDTERLLGGSGIQVYEENMFMTNHRQQKVNSSAETNKTKAQTMTEMGCYMDVSLQPVHEICLQEEAGHGPHDRTVRVIRTEGFCFSDTSCDSSTISSGLEWDFEEANGQWRESTSIRQENDWFPFQQCPTQNPLNFCTCAMSGPTTVSLAK